MYPVYIKLDDNPPFESDIGSFRALLYQRALYEHQCFGIKVVQGEVLGALKNTVLYTGTATVKEDGEIYVRIKKIPSADRYSYFDKHFTPDARRKF